MAVKYLPGWENEKASLAQTQFSHTSLIKFLVLFVLEESINEYRHEVYRECGC